MSENNNIVAIVNGKEISKDDVVKFLNDIGPQLAMQFQSPDGIKRVINEMVNQELFYFDALKTKMDEDTEFKHLLEITKTNLLKDYAVNKLISSVRATDEELRDYFDKNRNNFNRQESVSASHILIESYEKGKEILTEIENGLSFEEAAKNYSSCPSKDSGGGLGEFTKGQMVKEFEDAVFNMEVGEISNPVKTQFGYHIIKLTDKKPARISSFDEVKEQVIDQVIKLKQQNLYLNKVNELKSEYEVEIF
ncbi:MAG: peptidylprolyl isomerase [Tissierellia bacterium]|nr:peptidylprolyl isomerase [Tissierellia bacterium]